MSIDQRWALLASLLAVMPAWASDFLIHNHADDNLAAETLRSVTATAPTDLQPRPWADIRRTPAFIPEGGEVIPCTKAPTPLVAIRLEVERGESSFFYGDYEDARERVERAADALGCLAEPMDVALAAHAEFVHGATLFHLGQPDAAQSAFSRALQIDPQLRWNEDYPQESRERFEAAARQPDPSLLLNFLSPDPNRAMLIDGRPVGGGSLRVAVGTHLVQFGPDPWDSLRVKLPTDMTEGTLLVPAEFPEDALLWIGDSERRQDITDLFTKMLGKGHPTWIVVDDQVWTGTTGRDGWIRIDSNAASEEPVAEVPAEDDPPAEPEPPIETPPVEVAPPLDDPLPPENHRRFRPQTAMMIGGGAIAAGAGTVYLLSYMKANTVRAQLESDDLSYESAEKTWGKQYNTAKITRPIAIGGAIIAAAGLSLQFTSGTQLSPLVNGSTLGVQWSSKSRRRP